MALILDNSEPAINRGIKTAGVGKKGSKGLSLELALEILEDLKNGKVPAAAKGAFFAGLLAKGVEPQEEVLGEAFPDGTLDDPRSVVEAVAADAPEFARWVCVQLLAGHTLDKQTAYDLGKFLFSEEPGDGARGIVASYLRVRYETDDEYEGLLKALEETIDPAAVPVLPQGGPIVQIAEPFDGVDHSYMITPLVGKFLKEQGYRPVHMTGENSGPKWEMNLRDIFKELGDVPAYGFAAYENGMSPAFDRWNAVRRQTLKRPFLSTLERFINPFSADILIASAFHPPYGEKMMTIAERRGFKKIIIVRNGIEGSTAFPLMRPVKLLVSALQKDGTYKRQEISFESEATVSIEERIEHPRAKDNARLIEQYAKNGKTDNALFDLRVQATCAGLERALELLKEGEDVLG